MADSIYTFDPTAANNTSLDTIPYGPNQLYHNQIDNLFRAINAKTAQWVDDQGGIVTTTGSANAHAVTLASGVTAYATGLTFRVKFGYTNTSTTVNLNVNSIGNKRIKVNYGGIVADPIPGDIQAGAYGTLLYDGTQLVLLDAQQQGRYPPGTLYGLTLSNNGSDATNDIDIAVGAARDSTDAANIDLLSALTKRLDASWAVGTNQGMLDGTESVAGTPDTSTWYYIWLIKRPDTGVVDVLASESATAPTMPTNYTLKRRIGAVYRTSGAAIKAFRQRGDRFEYTAAAVDGNNVGFSGSRSLVTVTAPPNTTALSRILVYNTAGAMAAIVQPTAETDAAPSNNAAPGYSLATSAINVNSAAEFAVSTDASSQIALRASGASSVYSCMTYGFIDTRGRV